jgi:hypothetical protein
MQQMQQMQAQIQQQSGVIEQQKAEIGNRAMYENYLIEKLKSHMGGNGQ